MSSTTDDVVREAGHAWSGGVSWMLWISLGVAVVLIAFFAWDYYRDYCRRREFERCFKPKSREQDG